MVRSVVIPHDPARSPRLRHLATAIEFQAAVDGWLEPIEMPAPRPGALLRLQSRAPAADGFDESAQAGDAPW